MKLVLIILGLNVFCISKTIYHLHYSFYYPLILNFMANGITLFKLLNNNYILSLEPESYQIFLNIFSILKYSLQIFKSTHF